MMLQIPYDIPPAPLHIPDTFETWFGLFMVFWIFFGLVLLALPKSWSDSVIDTAFPFLPKTIDEGDHDRTH